MTHYFQSERALLLALHEAYSFAQDRPEHALLLPKLEQACRPLLARRGGRAMVCGYLCTICPVTDRILIDHVPSLSVEDFPTPYAIYDEADVELAGVER